MAFATKVRHKSNICHCHTPWYSLLKSCYGSGSMKRTKYDADYSFWWGNQPAIPESLQVSTPRCPRKRWHSSEERTYLQQMGLAVLHGFLWTPLPEWWFIGLLCETQTMSLRDSFSIGTLLMTIFVTRVDSIAARNTASFLNNSDIRWLISFSWHCFGNINTRVIFLTYCQDSSRLRKVFKK